MNGFQYGIKVVWIVQAKGKLLVNYLGKRKIWVVTFLELHGNWGDKKLINDDLF